jgi:hypothetical protein
MKITEIATFKKCPYFMYYTKVVVFLQNVKKFALEIMLIKVGWISSPVTTLVADY